jgi:hypothetical protein
VSHLHLPMDQQLVLQVLTWLNNPDDDWLFVGLDGSSATSWAAWIGATFCGHGVDIPQEAIKSAATQLAAAHKAPNPN